MTHYQFSSRIRWAASSHHEFAGPPGRYDYVAYMRTDLWFSRPPPALETLSTRHVTVPFCNPLPAQRQAQCDHAADGLHVRLRSRSDAHYGDALGRGTSAGCDVRTDELITHH